ncbi:hypothetical protein F5984_10415 [Rudanella paleaurantiibacter]|uniref:DUF4157 domain-containing protein n=1 Tax=Rudanella paleaurantiibacter TaxID=2614655 RepID=A0A7J5U0D0_9BACT|nr:hypothetical protein [Rudanella paleaurantiibacter]KAB7731208.1 hypothetical protein F5984_10415 [Rudanella paleaurantiibacter]
MILLVVPFLWVDGLTLWPFVLVRRPNPRPVLINHERIHLRQQLELGLVVFYLWYLFEYLYRLFQYGDHYTAYRNISFEREAFANDQNLKYLTSRRLFGFWRYVRLGEWQKRRS